MKSVRYNDSGEAVARLQRALVERGSELPRHGIDGHLGDEGWEALQRFAEDEGISVAAGSSRLRARRARTPAPAIHQPRGARTPEVNAQSLGLEIEGNYTGVVGGSTVDGKPDSEWTQATVQSARSALHRLVDEGRREGFGCIDEYEALLSCSAKLDCGGYEGSACAAEAEAFETACPRFAAYD